MVVVKYLSSKAKAQGNTDTSELLIDESGKKGGRGGRAWIHCDAAAASFVRHSSDLLDEIHTKCILSTLTCMY